MDKILTTEKAIKIIKQLKLRGKKVVLAGGCFDVLHRGHVLFLNSAKKPGDILIVTLESDRKVRELKGKQRPINSQFERATILSNLAMIDYVICLPYMKKNKDYEILVKQLEPDIIAVTKGDKAFGLKKNYAEMVGGRIIETIKRQKDYSTSKIAQKMKL